MTLQENKRYRVTNGDTTMEFIPLTIDREKNELYIKIVSPFSSHTGLVLSSIEENKFVPELVEEPLTKF